MKNSITILMLFCTILNTTYGQRELTITEMNSDADAVIEINGEDPQSAGFKSMMLGFNSSNDGWLRMRTNHDLSFWTDNSKRVTIKNDGNVGIDSGSPLQKLFVGNGRIAAETKTRSIPSIAGVRSVSETGFDIYTGTDIAGGLSYISAGPILGIGFPLEIIDPAFKKLTLDCADDCDLELKTNSIQRLTIEGDGDIIIPSFTSGDKQNVYVTSDGQLGIEDFGANNNYTSLNIEEFFKLTPIGSASVPSCNCDNVGTVYYDQSEDKIMVCRRVVCPSGTVVGLGASCSSCTSYEALQFEAIEF